MDIHSLWYTKWNCKYHIVFVPKYRKKYFIMKNEKDAIDKEELEKKLTEYFDSYDYIVGDWAYGKLRLKGFNSKTNTNFKEINDIDHVEEYLKNFCAPECRHFILSREK